MRLVITRAAEADLEAIGDYIAADRPKAAVKFVADMRATFSLLATMPKMGRAYSALGRGIRLFPSGEYVIIYRTSPSKVEVLSVLHSARDLQRMLEPA